MYFKTMVKAGKTLEVYRSFSKRTGKATGTSDRVVSKEEIEKNNRRRAIIKLTRVLNANFDKYSCHISLTYRNENRPSVEQAKKELNNFLRRLRREYKKRGCELKYIVVTEYKNKNVHHHIVINGIKGGGTLEVVQNQWRQGYIKCAMLDESGQYRRLAEYLIKETDKTFKEGKAAKQRYTPSRNLIIPKTKTKTVKANRWLPEPRIPKGYYLDSDTLFNGVDPFTGRLIQKYTLIQFIDEKKGRGKESG